LNWLGAFDEY